MCTLSVAFHTRKDMSLEYVPCQQRLQMWFMHDDTPAHFLRNVREHLTLTFEDRWIDLGGPTPWPVRSPNLNPLDFGYQKQPGQFQRFKDKMFGDNRDDHMELLAEEETILEVNDSCEQYGMKINADKTNAMAIGRKIVEEGLGAQGSGPYQVLVWEWDKTPSGLRQYGPTVSIGFMNTNQKDKEDNDKDHEKDINDLHKDHEKDKDMNDKDHNKDHNKNHGKENDKDHNIDHDKKHDKDYDRDHDKDHDMKHEESQFTSKLDGQG
ncbi:hypothetical protein ANN_14223 [Periplaneta americana]|uniref:Uncharacterized protein n=1 Tax=Periplaneta americana TaxID=6978 RepID=A0ABQ8SVQ5_PERAM|nr:hypothetical protein ANN_14223 [Periplaneta americana]